MGLIAILAALPLPGCVPGDLNFVFPADAIAQRIQGFEVVEFVAGTPMSPVAMRMKGHPIDYQFSDGLQPRLAHNRTAIPRVPSRC